jgi:hypothetical protein
MKLKFTVIESKGGPGSGNYGHAGRPNLRGGSMPKSMAMSRTSGKDAADRQAIAAGKKAVVEQASSSPVVQEPKLVDTIDSVPHSKYGRGYFINSDDKLLSVSDEFGGGTNDHVGFIMASEHPELIGLTKDAVSKFNAASKKLFGESGEDYNEEYEDKYNDELMKMWGKIEKTNFRVREFDLEGGKRFVSIQAMGQKPSRQILRRIQSWLDNKKLPYDANIQYDVELGTANGSFSLGELLSAKNMVYGSGGYSLELKETKRTIRFGFNK